MGKETRSAVTEYTDISAFSGSPAECRHHLIYGTAYRKMAEEDNLWIPLLNSEHNMSSDGIPYQIHGNPAAEKLSKMLGQAIWEKEYYRHYNDLFKFDEDISREAFRKRYGISYL